MTYTIMPLKTALKKRLKVPSEIPTSKTTFIAPVNPAEEKANLKIA